MDQIGEWGNEGKLVVLFQMPPTPGIKMNHSVSHADLHNMILLLSSLHALFSTEIFSVDIIIIGQLNLHPIEMNKAVHSSQWYYFKISTNSGRNHWTTYKLMHVFKVFFTTTKNRIGEEVYESIASGAQEETYHWGPYAHAQWLLPLPIFLPNSQITLTLC